MFLSCCVASAQDRKSDVLSRINAIRRSHGLVAVTSNPLLAAAAQSQSDWMASVGRMDHLREKPRSFEDFKTCSHHPADRMIQSGYFSFDELYRTELVEGGVVVHPRPDTNMKVGEIIARGWSGDDTGSPERVVRGWMNSPDHRAGILKGQYREAGVGVTSIRPGEYYWCVVFACR